MKLSCLIEDASSSVVRISLSYRSMDGMLVNGVFKLSTADRSETAFSFAPNAMLYQMRAHLALEGAGLFLEIMWHDTCLVMLGQHFTFATIPAHTLSRGI